MYVTLRRPSGRGLLTANLVATVALIAPSAAWAEHDQASQEITVVGQTDPLHLDQPTAVGSHLGLTARETPATVQKITQEDLQVRGLRTAREAFAGIPAAISGNVPGNPAAVMMRGFSGNAVSILQDGVRISTSTVVQRDTNTWHLDSIEVIKGPASVLYGEGALGGIINKVTRKPSFDGNHLDGLLSFGSFDTVMAAGGINYRVSDQLTVRADVSNMRSDSLYDVKFNETRATGATASALFRPSSDVSILIAVDHYNDRYDSTYQGLPLVSATVARDPSDVLQSANGLVIDKSLRRENYNPAGSYSGADETTLRSRIDWKLGHGWSWGTDLTWYTADRAFVLSDTQTFVAPNAAFPNGSFNRTVQRFLHDHAFWNVRSAVANDSVFAGMRNRFTIGMEYNHTDFASLRQSSAANVVAPVDPWNPDVGTFPTSYSAWARSNLNFDSTLKAVSVFTEDALNLAPKWLLVGGLRYDHYDLDRGVTDYNSATFQSAGSSYDPFSWRIGTTYDLSSGLTVYALYTTAVTPVSSMLLQSIANTKFKLTTGKSAEGGFKLSAWNDRITATGAAFWIRQDDILTRDPSDPSITVQGGSQSSRGAEFSLAAAITRYFSLGGSVGYVNAKYDELLEAGGAVRTGNRPINTPETTVTANVTYTIPETHLTLSGAVNRVSGFYTDTANTIHVNGRTTFDAAISWQVADQARLTLRGRNLTDRFYVEYSGYPTTNVYIGAPRSVELSLATHF